MNSQSAFKLPTSAIAATSGDCWKLANGQAMTLRPRNAGALRINSGQVWATLDGPHSGPSNGWGDLFLKEGQILNLQSGQRVVIEPRGDAANRSAYLEWETTPAEQSRDLGSTSKWQRAVVLPASDLVAALVLAISAASRLATGLLGYTEFIVAARGKVLRGLESNQP